MVLGYETIKKLIKKKKLIENGNSLNIHSSSYDVTIDKTILKFKQNKDIISLIDADQINNMYEIVRISNGFILEPGDTILITLEEVFNMPNNICGKISGRTSFNRLGITIANQHINPGFKGKLNITVTNNSNNQYYIMPKIQIAQVIFEKMNKRVKKCFLYNNQSNKKYNNQDGQEGSIIYNDFIGKVVRHYKGNYYYIEDICIHSETNEYTVIYKPLYDNNKKVWARPAKMFFEEIDINKKDNITKQAHRFELVDDLTKDYTKKR